LDTGTIAETMGTNDIFFVDVWDTSSSADFVHDCRVEFETTDVLQR
jgi:hypothetical protein